MGRKPKIEPEIQSRICAMISVGCSLRAAARLNDCRESTVRALAKRDKNFNARLTSAEQVRELTPLRNLQAAGTKSWRAAAWALERLNPEEYGRRPADAFYLSDFEDFVRGLADTITQAVSDPDDRRAVGRAIRKHTDRAVHLLREQRLDEAVGRSVRGRPRPKSTPRIAHDPFGDGGK